MDQITATGSSSSSKKDNNMVSYVTGLFSKAPHLFLLPSAEDDRVWDQGLTQKSLPSPSPTSPNGGGGSRFEKCVARLLHAFQVQRTSEKVASVLLEILEAAPDPFEWSVLDLMCGLPANDALLCALRALLALRSHGGDYVVHLARADRAHAVLFLQELLAYMLGVWDVPMDGENASFRDSVFGPIETLLLEHHHQPQPAPGGFTCAWMHINVDAPELQRAKELKCALGDPGGINAQSLVRQYELYRGIDVDALLSAGSTEDRVCIAASCLDFVKPHDSASLASATRRRRPVDVFLACQTQQRALPLFMDLVARVLAMARTYTTVRLLSPRILSIMAGEDLEFHVHTTLVSDEFQILMRHRTVSADRVVMSKKAPGARRTDVYCTKSAAAFALRGGVLPVDIPYHNGSLKAYEHYFDTNYVVVPNCETTQQAVVESKLRNPDPGALTGLFKASEARMVRTLWAEQQLSEDLASLRGIQSFTFKNETERQFAFDNMNKSEYAFLNDVWHFPNPVTDRLCPLKAQRFLR